MKEKREFLNTQHVWTGKAWVHIVSPTPVSAEVAQALLYANDVLSAQYGVTSAKYIQAKYTLDADVLITELGVGLLSYPELEDVSETCLLSNKVYREFCKFWYEPEEFKGLDAVLTYTHRHWGLICGVVALTGDGGHQDYGNLEAETAAVSVVGSDRSQGVGEAVEAESGDREADGT